MADKCCTTCIYCKPPTPGFSMATCEYPVPEWLSIQCSKFVDMPDYSGKNCATHKTLLQVSQEQAIANGKFG